MIICDSPFVVAVVHVEVLPAAACAEGPGDVLVVVPVGIVLRRALVGGSSRDAFHAVLPLVRPCFLASPGIHPEGFKQMKR